MSNISPQLRDAYTCLLKELDSRPFDDSPAGQDDLLSAMERFVEVFEADPDAKHDLEQRAQFVAQQTADGTAYAKAREKARAMAKAKEEAMAKARRQKSDEAEAFSNAQSPTPFEALLQSDLEAKRILAGQLFNEQRRLKGRLRTLAADKGFRRRRVQKEGKLSAYPVIEKIPKTEADQLQKERVSLQACLDESKAVYSRARDIGADGCWYLKNPDGVPFGYEGLDDVLKDITVAAMMLMDSLSDPDDQAPAHSDDFRSVNWYGTEYTFTSSQAACVKVLWEHWERKTPEVSQHTVLTVADISGERLDNVFRNSKGKQHSAWGTMIVRGTSKGTFRLNRPSD